MPVTPKDLYLADGLEKLNGMAELPPNLKKSAPKILAKSAANVYKNAVQQQMLGDEEKAYVLFMKFMNLYTVVKRTQEYKKDQQYYNDMIGQQNLPRALMAAEEICANLSQRYDEKRAEAVADALPEFTLPDIPTENEQDEITPIIEKEISVTPYLSATELYSILTSDLANTLVIDVRSRESYSESHLRVKDIEYISIPEDIIKPPVMPKAIAQQLQGDTLKTWESKHMYSRIILVDWNSRYSSLKPTDPIQAISDAMYKWDQTSKLKTAPQVLDGGYESWVRFYPTHTTNPAILTKKKYVKPEMPSLNFEYPEFGEDDLQDGDLPTDTQLNNGTTGTASAAATRTTSAAAVSASPNNNNKSTTVFINGGTTTHTAHINGSTTHDTNTNNGLTISHAANINGAITTNNSGLTTFATNPNTYPSKQFVPALNRSNKPKPRPQTLANGSGDALNGVNGRVLPSDDKNPSTASQSTTSPTASSSSTPTPQAAARTQPVVNRAVKPTNRESVDSYRPIPATRQRDESDMFAKLSLENQEFIAARQQRLDQLKSERAQLTHLSDMKRTESQEVAGLMRMKKQLEKEIEQQKQDLSEAKHLQAKHSLIPTVDRSSKPEVQKAELEDWEKRLSELQDHSSSEESLPERMETTRDKEEIMSEVKNGEAEEKARLKARAEEQVELRKAEEQKIIDESKRLAEEAQVEKNRRQAEAAEEARQEELAAKERDRLLAEHKQREEQEKQRRVEEERRKQEMQERVERERQARMIKEDRERKLAEELTRREEERLAQEKLETERLEKERIAQEETLKREQAREKREMAERIARSNKPSSTRLGVMDLPPGWQRKRDENGKVIFYNHHTNKYTYDPPAAPPPPSTSLPSTTKNTPTPSRYTTKIKETTFSADDDLSAERKHGMKRFNSQPNLAKLDDEKIDQPKINRTVKPTPAPRIDPSQFISQLSGQRLKNLSPSYGAVDPGLCGLYNMGNTCYMNSTLQCLNHTPELNMFFRSDNYAHVVNSYNAKGSRGLIAREMACLLKALWIKNYEYIVPRDFKFHMGQARQKYDHYKQMDSQEFLLDLLDVLHEDVNEKGHTKASYSQDCDPRLSLQEAATKAMDEFKMHNQSIIGELFQGLQRSRVQCSSCSHTSHKFETYNCLPLEIPGSYRQSVTSCLRQYLAGERLEDYKCDKCKRVGSSHKNLDLWKLPNIVMIFLKRFKQNMYGQTSKKNNDITFDLEFSLDTHPDSRQKVKRYKLYGVINHSGTLDSGHYWAYCKNQQRWYNFNDERVSEISRHQVQSSAAYVLFYTSLSSQVTR